MGALETLYELIYGGSPDSGESDLLGAPKRLQYYALTKLLQGSNAYNDLVDANSDWEVDREVRLSGRLPFEERQSKKRQSRAEYARQRLKEIIEEEAARSGKTAPKGGPASGGDPVPPSIARAEYVGQLAPDTGASPYNEAKKPTFNQDEFRAALGRYVSGAESEEAARIAQAREDSVGIEIPGGYEGLQRIAQQALMKGSGEGGLAFGDKWPYEVSRQPGSSAASVPGGTFSSVGRTLTGGDTQESLRAYADNYKNTEVDRQIGLIERAFPAANRPPALDAKLQSLYEARANRDREETIRQRLPVEQRQADADYMQAEGMKKYYSDYNETQRYVADKGYEEAKLDYETTINKGFNTKYNSIADALGRDTANPRARAGAVFIKQILGRTDLSISEKEVEINRILDKLGYNPASILTDVDLATPEGSSKLDSLLYGSEP